MVTCHVSPVTCHLSYVITRTGTSTEKIIENAKAQTRLEMEARRADYIIHQKKALKIRKYTYSHIFSLTTSRSRKLIPKADLK